MTQKNDFLDKGPFFHGTKAQLKIGDVLEPKRPSNYEEGRISNYIYFTATLEAAKWGAELAKGTEKEAIYLVEPLGEFENDPNLTDKRFPGNPTRSYRSKQPLRIVAILGMWERHSDDAIQNMLKGLKELKESGQATIID